jgi:hypothetical protein
MITTDDLQFTIDYGFGGLDIQLHTFLRTTRKSKCLASAFDAEEERRVKTKHVNEIREHIYGDIRGALMSLHDIMITDVVKALPQDERQRIGEAFDVLFATAYNAMEIRGEIPLREPIRKVLEERRRGWYCEDEDPFEDS